MTKPPAPQPTDLAPRLLPWFDRERRAMPWRGETDPYRIWISEIMLQQTQVTTVIPYYERFLAALPNVQALAAASLDEVLALWAGLGYYSRARHLHAAAQIIVQQHGGQFPAAYGEARALPGIGAYAAGAILSIAYGQRVPALDGNAGRVLARVFAVPGEIARGAAKRHLNHLAQEAVPADRPGDYNQALMELGSQVCLPAQPRCEACPLAEICRARPEKLHTVIPEVRRAPTCDVQMAAAVLERGGKVLVAHRPATGVWGGLWEFPNLEVTGQPRTALARHLRQHWGLRAAGLEEFATLSHGIMNRQVALTAYRCKRVVGRGESDTHVAVSWVTPEELKALALPAPHRKLAQRLAEQTGDDTPAS